MTDSLHQQLALMQLADSFFPSGAYTLSHGLESLVQSGVVETAEDVEAFVRLLLLNKIGPMDLVAIAHVHSASQNNNMPLIQDIDARLFAQTPIEKTRVAQRQSGRALLMVAGKTWPHEQLDWLSQQTAKGEISCLHPIVFAVVARVAGLSMQETALAFTHGFTTGLLGAAIRLGAVGHLEAQQVRLRLANDIATICRRYEGQFSLGKTAPKLEDMWTCTPLIDLAQMRQAKLSRRLFAS